MRDERWVIFGDGFAVAIKSDNRTSELKEIELENEMDHMHLANHVIAVKA